MTRPRGESTLHDALIDWLLGADVAVIDDGMPPASSVCPPPDGATD